MDFEEELARCYNDPLRFAIWAFPWGDLPELSLVPLQEPWASLYPGCKYGPDVWTCELLDRLGEKVRANNFDGRHSVMPVKIAVSSGHGIGKSFTSALLVCWILATRPHCKGIITSNTKQQLESKTWAEITKWLKRSLVADMFEIKAESIQSKEHPESWRIDAQTCKEENSEAFAGQHSASSSSFYLFDEASNIPDKIWEVAEGGMTDGEPFWFVFGNPTRNTGRFRECFKAGTSWLTRKIDSRSAYLTNKQQIEAWKEEHGEDSDFFRVRVLGEFPSASDRQLIPTATVEEASQRDVTHMTATCAIIGVDVARYGDDNSVIYTRVGRAWLPIKRFKKLSTVDLANRVISHRKEVSERLGIPINRVYINIDGTGVGGGVVDMLKDYQIPCYDVQFASSADEPDKYYRKRDELWGRMKHFLVSENGTIPNDEELKQELISPEYDFDKMGPNGTSPLKVESKKSMRARGLSSPDTADALALTFARRIEEYLPFYELNRRQEESVSRRSFDPYKDLGRGG